MTSFGGVPADMDPVSGDRWDDGEAERLADRVAHLEEMQVRNERTMADQAKLIRDQKDTIATLRATRERLAQELAGARVIIEARDSRVAQLEKALERRNGQLADATDAAEAYRMERDAARATIDAVGRLIDPQD
jgi:chromosome segregation ATPase